VGVRGAVGATKSVEEMMAGEGIVIGCGEGLERKRAATRITRRMMPLMMIQGRRDRLDIY
jgi:3-dehydroquinate synthase class II